MAIGNFFLEVCRSVQVNFNPVYIGTKSLFRRRLLMVQSSSSRSQKWLFIFISKSDFLVIYYLYIIVYCTRLGWWVMGISQLWEHFTLSYTSWNEHYCWTCQTAEFSSKHVLVDLTHSREKRFFIGTKIRGLYKSQRIGTFVSILMNDCTLVEYCILFNKISLICYLT